MLDAFLHIRTIAPARSITFYTDDAMFYRISLRLKENIRGLLIQEEKTPLLYKGRI